MKKGIKIEVKNNILQLLKTVWSLHMILYEFFTTQSYKYIWKNTKVMICSVVNLVIFILKIGFSCGEAEDYLIPLLVPLRPYRPYCQLSKLVIRNFPTLIKNYTQKYTAAIRI